MTNGGRHSGVKLWRSLGVARQLNRVLTKTTPAVAVDRDVVDVEVAGGVAELRHVEPVVALVRLPGLAGRSSNRQSW